MGDLKRPDIVGCPIRPFSKLLYFLFFTIVPSGNKTVILCEFLQSMILPSSPQLCLCVSPMCSSYHSSFLSRYRFMLGWSISPFTKES